MHLKRIIYFFGLFIFLFNVNQAQDSPYIDSLRNALARATNATDSVGILCRLSWDNSESEKGETKKYGLLALRTSKKISDSVLVADAYDAAANGFWDEGDIESAKKLYMHALQIGLRNNIEARCAWSSYHLAKIALSEDNLRKGEDYARNSYRYFDQVSNPGMAISSLYLLNNINTKYTDTLIHYISKQIKKISDENSRLFYYLQLASLYNQLENRKQAMRYVQQAMELADKNQNIRGIIKAYFQIAAYFQEYQKDYKTALAYYEKILEINRKNNITELKNPYIQIGDLYGLMGNDSLALYYFNKGLDAGKRKKHRHTIASAFMKLGDLDYQQQHYQDAKYFYLKCYKTGCDICPSIKFHDALVNLGNVYAMEGDIQNALMYYGKSLKLADSADDHRAQTNSYQAFGNLFENQGDMNRAGAYYRQAFQTAQEANYLEGQQVNAAKLSRIFRLNNNHLKAFEYLTIANTLSDSIRMVSEADNLAKLETHFEFQNLQMQRELDEARSDEEIARQKLYRNFFVIGFILVSFSGFLIYRGYQRKKKDNVLLHEQKQAIEGMSKKVHEADEAKLQFFTNVSHELRTPLTLILGTVEKLKDSQYICLIRKNSLKLLQLINHLLDLRKLDASGMKLSVHEGKINEFLSGIIGSFEDHARQKGISIKFLPKDGQTIGYFDHEKLEKIFSNLLSNAIKYAYRDGAVQITTWRMRDGFFSIEVSDDGMGIPEKELNKIFDRFYRVSENDHNGSGIGLALAKELVELHKGEITIRSKQNEGTSLTFKIPIEKQYYSDHEVTSEGNNLISWNYGELLDIESEKDEAHADPPDPNRKSVLIVEDNHDLRKFISEIFEDEYAVMECSNGAEGYKMALECIPDIIISDIMMPKLSGIQLVDKVKNNPTTSHIPVILLTAKNDIGTRLSGFEKGADDYISKPFESVILKSRVENLLRLRKQLVEKFSKQFHLRPREITIEDADQKFLQRTIDIIENHISDTNLSIDLLALELGVSRTQLYRKLKALTDYSANQFIRVIRIKRAAQILQQGQHNIAEVMDATGFSNYSYFNNCFKEHFGEFPKEYVLVHAKGSLN